ncbi:MAG: ATP-binding protein [Blastocatellales bacterium]
MQAITQIINQPLSLEQRYYDPQFNCAECEDRGWVFALRGVKECECKKSRYRSSKLSVIPAEYEHLRLEMMAPQKHPKQTALLSVLRNDPYKSLVMLGPHGTGKTAIGFVLYRRAVEENRPAVYVTLANLLEDLKIAEYKDDHVPCISASALSSGAKDAARWLLFVDDFNAGRATPFTGEALLRILNEAYQWHHQIVITAHCSMRHLRGHWEKAGEGYGGSIIRRIEQAHNSLVVDFFASNT